MKRVAIAFALLLAVGALGAWTLSAPAVWSALHPQPAPATRTADLRNGEVLFHAGGCASCHASPGRPDGSGLGGGAPLVTPFGVFHPPNISSDRADGIGGWTLAAFTRAMREGVSPAGETYYPAFPYTSYQRMSVTDVADLFAYLGTLPAVAGRAPPHDLPFPVSIRRGVGLWRLAFLDGRAFAPDASQSAQWNRGAYLVNGPGHCADCHSPRNMAGAIVEGRRFAGGPDPQGKGMTPNITPAGLKGWSATDVAEMLKTGFKPDYDSVAGSMAEVVKNTAHLSDEDRLAIGAYLLSLPALESAQKR